MNPSASGWIKKLLKTLEDELDFFNITDDVFHNALRECGFIYGNNINVIGQLIDKTDLSEEELCKTNLCISFFYTFKNSNSKTKFTESVINFYDDINALKKSFFQELFGDKKSNEQLEKIINKRVQINPNILTKNFNYFITNALLYTDILAYAAYLKTESISIRYLKNLEASISSVSFDVLNTKTKKNNYDESLIKLFESSLRFQNNDNTNYNKVVKSLNTLQEKYYILDLACMASWTDKIIDEKEEDFLNKLGEDFNLSKINVEQAITSVNTFYIENKNNIALLSSKNIVQSFYTNSSKMVNKLITRNSKRLYKELIDSKELMVLLSQSTIRDLTADEQKKVQNQLLDIFKTIPSLAIFILPGGAILLPLVVKFIPKLLPSAFDENRIED